MGKIISLHHYGLLPGADEARFEQALRQAQESGLLRLPDLVDYHFIKGIKGEWCGRLAAVWIYESREEEILAPFLDCDPDRIEFTSYEVM